MDGVVGVDSLVAVAAVALLAPLVLGLLPRLVVPQVVLLLAGGIVIGPHVLVLGGPGDVQVLADVGLGFVFLLAGYEVDLRLFGEDAGRRAVAAWFAAAALALGAVALLAAAGLVRALVPIALGLTTTALGTAAGAAGEGPAAGPARTPSAGRRRGGGTLPDPRRPGGRVATVIELGQHETAQLTLRGTVLLLVALIAVTDRVHLDGVLGAFLAGVVLRRWAGPSAPVLESKLVAVGYGFFIPVFFVYSGMRLDLPSLVEAPLRLLLFFLLLLACRGLPALLVYRGVLTRRQRVQTALVTATALPTLVALAEIGMRNGTMLPEYAAALVGAGVLTVLLLPGVAVTLHRPGRTTAPDASAEVGGMDPRPAD